MAEFQHTAARRRLLQFLKANLKRLKFQHTAARRRLLYVLGEIQFFCSVSTHSRTEAAAAQSMYEYIIKLVSTHSRTEAAASIC